MKQLIGGKPPDDLLDMALTLPLGLGAMGYFAAYSARKAAYRSGIFRQVMPAVPTISVGNLTIGGTGKTPVTIFLAEQLTARGYRCAVLTRGYARRKKTLEPLIVSTGSQIRASAQTAGDEPFLMAASLDKTPVIVARKRRLGALAAIREFSPDVLLLDDGFQHWPLDRHVNLVLWDANLLPSETSLLPMGPLREPLKAIDRADAIIYTRSPSNEKLQRVRSQIERQIGKRQYFAVAFDPHEVVSLDGKTILSRDQAKEMSFFAFCALARPEQFVDSLKGIGVTMKGHSFFPDHYYFSGRDMNKVGQRARASGADALLTTAKDAVKLEDLSERAGMPIFVLSIATRFEPEESRDEFLDWLEEQIEVARREG